MSKSLFARSNIFQTALVVGDWQGGNTSAIWLAILLKETEFLHRGPTREGHAMRSGSYPALWAGKWQTTKVNPHLIPFLHRRFVPIPKRRRNIHFNTNAASTPYIVLIWPLVTIIILIIHLWFARKKLHRRWWKQISQYFNVSYIKRLY